MKNLIYYSALFAIVFFSCKKEIIKTKTTNVTPEVSDGQLFPVNFTISGLADNATNGAQTSSLQTNRLEDQIQYLTYYLYDSVGLDTKRLKKIEKKPYYEFGMIADSLKKGTYYAFFVGSKSPGYDVKVDPFWNQFGDLKYHEQYILTYGNNPIGDTFTAAVKLTVKSSVNNSQAVVLKRAVSKVTVTILDAVPSNATKITYLIGNADPGFNLLNHSGQWTPSHGEGWDDRLLTFNLKESDKGKKNYSFSTYLFYWSTTVNILAAYDANNNLLASKEVITPVPETNHQYIVQGKLFDNPSFFTITVNDKWTSPELVPFNIPVVTTIKTK